ncbi:MAG: pitrilysin family protein [Verrucomicrobiota bacterium]
MPASLISAADQRMLDNLWARPVHRSVLPNGLTLLVQTDDSAPVASVQVWVKTGSIHEDRLLGSGVSHFLEHMLFKGTPTRAGRDISATLQSHGGLVNAYTSFERTVYYVDLPAVHAGVGLEVLGDMVLNSTLPADEFAKERDVILREIAMVQDDPDQRLGETLFATAYREHPHKYPIIGYKDVFSSLTRDDLLGYLRARYVPNNLVVVVAGDVDPAEIEAKVAAVFGAAPRGRLAPVIVSPEPPQSAPRESHRFEDVELTRAGFSWHVPGLRHADVPGLDLLAAVLGHGDSSILWQALREKARLVHSIDAHCWTPADGGVFTISFTCEPGKRAAAERAVRRELDRVAAKGFPPALLRKAARQLVVGEINSRKTVSGRAGRLGSAEVCAGDLDFARSFFARLARVKSTDLRRLVRDYLAPSAQTCISLNPLASAPPAATVKPPRRTAATGEPLTLPNGARLLLLPASGLPNLHLRLLFEGGPSQEPADRRGVTTLLATMLTRDTIRRSAAAVAGSIEEVGGSFYPFSGNNSFGLALEVLPADLDRGLTLLTEALSAPAFKAGTLDIEREAQLAELQQDADDVVTFARKLIRRSYFEGHPFAVDATGDADGLKAVKPADLRALWKRLGVAGNAVLVASGDFDPKQLAPRLKALLARLPKGKAPARPAPFAAPVARDLVEQRACEQAVVFDAFPGPGLLEADQTVAEVVDELFSGMSSRLFERVREEKGLAYFVRSSRIVGVNTGMFCLFAGTAPATAGAVRAEFDAELARVRAGRATKAELERCRTRLKAGRRMGLQTNAARAMHAGLNLLFGQPLETPEQYDARIDAVTAADVKTFVRERLRPDARVRLVVRP